MVKHRGKFKWKKYSKYSGNLKDYWTHPDRGHERHRMIEGSIVAAIQRYHPEWEPPADNGYEWVSCLCPFHGDTYRSASVSFSRDAFHCFACPAKGDVIGLIRQQEGVPYGEAFRIAETISEGSYPPLSRKSARKPRRRTFGEPGAGSTVNQGQGSEVQVGVRQRSSPWT
jgi:hypothetical protein